MSTCSEIRDQLDAFLDEEADGSARGALEAHVAQCRACAARLRAEKLIRARLAEALDERAPVRLHDAVRATILPAEPRADKASQLADRADDGIVRRLPRADRTRKALSAFALAASLAALLGVWLLGRSAGTRDAWAAELARDHVHHGDEPAGLGERAEQPQQVEAWFLRRHGMRVRVPAVPSGGRLVGAQLCPVNGRSVVHVVYEVDGRLVSYFVVPDASAPESPASGRVGDLRYVGWREGGGAVYALGPFSAKRLQEAFASG